MARETSPNSASRISAFSAERAADVRNRFIAALILLGMLLASADGLSGEELPGEFTGHLSLAFVGARKTNDYSFILRSDPPAWAVHFVDEMNRDRMSDFVSLSGETMLLTSFLNNSPTGKMNTADIRLYPGARPFDSRGLEHIWLAFLSRGSFFGHRPPTRDPGLCMAEPCVISVIDFPEGQTCPLEMDWHNERSDLASKPEHLIEGHFEVGGVMTLENGMKVPKTSSLAIYLTAPGGERSLITYSELVLDKATPLSGPVKEFPVVKGKNAVRDFRLSDMWERKPVDYRVADGKIPDAKSALPESLFKKKYNYQSTSAALFFWVGITTLGLLVPTLVLIQKRRNKQQQQ